MVSPLSQTPGYVDPSKMHQRFVEDEVKQSEENQQEVQQIEAVQASPKQEVPAQEKAAAQVEASGSEGFNADTSNPTVPKAEAPDIAVPDIGGVLKSILGSEEEPEIDDAVEIEMEAMAFAPVPSARPEAPAAGALRAILSGDGRPENKSKGSGVLPASLRAALDKTEGGGSYDTLFGHSQKKGQFANVRVSEMTIGQVLDFQKPSGRYGQWVKEELRRRGHKARVATPVGRHQIVGTTLRAAVRQLGLSMDTKFSPETQDRIALHLARNAARRGIAGLRSEWEGFKSLPASQLEQIRRDVLKR